MTRVRLARLPPDFLAGDPHRTYRECLPPGRPRTTSIRWMCQHGP